jgi:hypothetical protein
MLGGYSLVGLAIPDSGELILNSFAVADDDSSSSKVVCCF